MGIAIKDDHLELARVAASFLEQRGARAGARATLDAPDEVLPGWWKEVADLGWLALHLPEDLGGQGAGMEEAAIVAEAMGAAAAPGPYVATVAASALLAAVAPDELRRALVPRLADGSLVGAVGRAGGLTRAADGTVSGDAGLVLGAGLAGVLLLVVGDDVVVVERDAPGVAVQAVDSLDTASRVAAVTLDGADGSRLLAGAASRATRILRVLGAATAAGLCRTCTTTSVAYARERVQFGRVIGTFQAVKHLCADLLGATEVATASAWDAARAAHLDGDEGDLAAATAAAVALPAGLRCAEGMVQVHGGIGFTWEHDAHLFLRRAAALLAVVDGDRSSAPSVATMAASGVERELALQLPPEAEQIRTEVRAFVAGLEGLDPTARRAAIVDAGYAFPHWPLPWGRAAGAVEQLVIEEEMEGVERPDLGIGAWITLTLSSFGTDDQKARYLRHALMGDVYWCQLFSEPDAGSDAANVQTSATRVDGGWLLNGQKVWTSGAHRSTHGWATVRTNRTERKHDGITMVIVDMAAKGVEIRPLRQITGGSEFNEVFFTDVFVPDDDVVGPVDGGWAIARATLGNERVSIGGNAGAGSSFLLGLLAPHLGQRDVERELGDALAQGQALRLIGLRAAERAVLGAEPSAEGNVAKLLGSEHLQRAARLGLLLSDGRAAAIGATGSSVAYQTGDPALRLLSSRGSSIAGGTSEIARNQIAERILGLPRDPLLR